MEKKRKHEKEALLDFDSHVKDLRSQFSDQLRVIEQRTDAQVALMNELQDYYKRRADIEADYGRALDKLGKHVHSKAKSVAKNELTWHQFSLYTHYLDVVQQTRVEARQRAVIADVYSNHVCARLGSHADAVQRVSKRCLLIAEEQHKEMLRVMDELMGAMKCYQICHASAAITESKFRATEAQKLKFEAANPKKITSRRYKAIEKDFERKHHKYTASRIAALKARNEYIMCIEAANSALHRYYADDISDLIDCLDVGLSQWFGATFSSVVKSAQCCSDAAKVTATAVQAWIDSVDPRLDKQRFLEANHALFSLPRKVEFVPHGDDAVCQVSGQRVVQDDLVQRHGQMAARLAQMKADNEEVWKTLESAEKTLLRKARSMDLNIEQSFQKALTDDPVSSLILPGPQRRTSMRDAASSAASSAALSNNNEVAKSEENVDPKRKISEMVDLEQFYLDKFRMYCLTSNLMSRLSARQKVIEGALGVQTNGNAQGSSNETSTATPSPVNDIVDLANKRPPNVPPKPSNAKRKRIGRSTGVVQPRLFGGTLEEFIENSGQEIPLVIRSCVHRLSVYGLHHQGLFRVSGSQIEINAFREAFERGEDPLDDADASAVNSIAGVLKLYFRELREPLFPMYMFDAFTTCATRRSKDDFITEVRELVLSLPRSIFVVMRYMFGFLNHLSEFSDENMMDPYNLAICFGPTLIPIPESRDQVFYHNHVNELIKSMIVWQELIFPVDSSGGPIYEKYLLMDEALEDDATFCDDVTLDHTVVQNDSDDEDGPPTLDSPDSRPTSLAKDGEFVWYRRCTSEDNAMQRSPVRPQSSGSGLSKQSSIRKKHRAPEPPSPVSEAPPVPPHQRNSLAVMQRSFNSQAISTPAAHHYQEPIAKTPGSAEVRRRQDSSSKTTPSRLTATEEYLTFPAIDANDSSPTTAALNDASQELDAVLNSLQMFSSPLHANTVVNTNSSNGSTARVSPRFPSDPEYANIVIAKPAGTTPSLLEVMRSSPEKYDDADRPDLVRNLPQNNNTSPPSTAAGNGVRLLEGVYAGRHWPPVAENGSPKPLPQTKPEPLAPRRSHSPIRPKETPSNQEVIEISKM